jgi:putative Ca2+/H+ antiporter (TMEM165/GDT1 family)
MRGGGGADYAIAAATASAACRSRAPERGTGYAERPSVSQAFVEAFLVSTGIVALGEMGDKTQLLALLLAARFGKPLPIIAGILVATLANHALAAWLGGWIAGLMGPQLLRWMIGGAFLAMAVWMLVPDRLDEAEAVGGGQRYGIFGSTVLAFFLTEMGDKTQIATVALAARYLDWLAVVTGTTLGMMLANVPAVLLGDQIATKLSMTLLHGVAAAIFAVLGLLTLFNVGQLL